MTTRAQALKMGTRTKRDWLPAALRSHTCRVTGWGLLYPPNLTTCVLRGWEKGNLWVGSEGHQMAPESALLFLCRACLSKPSRISPGLSSLFLHSFLAPSPVTFTTLELLYLAVPLVGGQFCSLFPAQSQHTSFWFGDLHFWGTAPKSVDQCAEFEPQFCHLLATWLGKLLCLSDPQFFHWNIERTVLIWGL